MRVERMPVDVRSRMPVEASAEPETALQPARRPVDAAGLAILVLSVAVGLALVLLATATFIEVVR